MIPYVQSPSPLDVSLAESIQNPKSILSNTDSPPEIHLEVNLPCDAPVFAHLMITRSKIGSAKAEVYHGEQVYFLGSIREYMDQLNIVR